MNTTGPAARPTRWEWVSLGLFVCILVGFGVLVVYRSAGLSRRMGDAGCYFRAAWAVRAGQDLYDVTCDNNWHYNYPPLLAILMTPLADPPKGADTAGMTPYGVSVAIWYVFGLACLAAAVHGLARAIESTAEDPAVRARPAGCRAWWALRLLPVLACIPAVGHTLMRGQVNLLVLVLLCGTMALLLRGRSAWAGVCLALAACVKVIPAFLVLYPLWRRDARCLAGFAVGLLVGLVLIPVAVFGPERTVALYEKWGRVLLAPALGAADTDKSRARELIEVWATDTQAPLAVIHNTLTPDRNKRIYPPQPWVRRAHWAIGGGLTVVTLLVGGWRRRDRGPSLPLFLGALSVPMLLLSPVCHRHYFALCIPLVAGILADTWERRPYPYVGWGTWLFLTLYAAANAVTLFPNTEPLMDMGAGMYATLALWLVALWRLGRRNLAERRRARAEELGAAVVRLAGAPGVAA